MNPLLAALVQAGIIDADTADRINRTMDPDAARAWAEQQLAAAMQLGLSAQQARLVELVQRNPNVTAAQLDAFWRGEDERLYATLLPSLDAIAIDRALNVAIRAATPDMWNVINQAVLDWTHTYYLSAEPSFVGSVRNLNQTSRQQVADAFARWNRGELEGTGLPALIQALEPTFGTSRAAAIGITETTRLFAEAERAALDADPDLEFLTWAVARDELVCTICAPLDGRSVRSGQEFAPGITLPPAHVNCRCVVTASTAAVEERLGNRN